MRTRAITTILITTGLALGTAGCGGGDGDSNKAGKPAASKTFDCSDTGMSQADWTRHCSDETGTAEAGEETPAPAAAAMPLGKTVETIGARNPFGGGPGGGGLEVTPTTITYAKTTMGETAANGIYAIITVKDRAPNAVAAAESAPIEGGGWQWIAPDGQAVNEGEGDASSITPEGFTGGGMVQPGTYRWRTIAFDLASNQRGGTLAYTDGDAKTYRWAMPATEQGPELAKLKKGMEGNYG